MIIDFKNQELNINYIDEGCGDAVVLLHGWGACAKTYRCIIDCLKPYFRVIAPDMPGFGKSDEPSFPFDSSDYANFVECFLTKLGISGAVFIGHSHGGRTILKLASNKDTKIHFSKIILFDSAGLKRKKSISQILKILTFKTAKKIYQLPGISKFFPDMIENMRRKNGSADYASASDIMRKSLVKVINEDLTDCLEKIYAPTLLIWGENDTDTPMYQAEKMEKLIPDAGLVVIKGAGHFSFLADFGKVKSVLYSFLNIN